MADKLTLPATGGVVLTDEVTDGTLGTGHVQFVKILDGTLDGTSKAAVGANGLAVDVKALVQADGLGTGTISATDALCPAPGGAGVLLSTAPTANSFVAFAIPGGSSQVDIQILGTATGTYYFEQSMDSTTGSDGNWIATNFRQTGIVNTVLGFSFTTNGIFRGNSAGFKYVRVRNVGGTTPSNAVTIRESYGSGTMFQNASTPAGTNIIGKVGIDQTTPGTTNLVALAANQSVNAAQINGVTPLMGNGVTGTGSLRVTVASDNTAFPVNATLSAETTKVIGTVNIAASQTVATVTTVSAVTAISNALPAGTNLMGKVGIDQTTAGTTNGVVENATAAAGGITTTTRLLSAAASTNATSAKGSAGRLYSIQGYNAATAVRYLKLYNKATAPTVGTDTPVKTLALPPGAAFALDWPVGYSFATGIAFALTTGGTDADTGALTAADVLGLNLDYV